jgi:type VI secretion system Hcp family effector
MPIYVKFPEPLMGESQSSNHEGSVEAQSLNWGVSQPYHLVAAGQKKGTMSRRAECGPIRLSRVPDKSSAALLMSCIEAKKAMDEVLITVCDSDTDDTPNARLILKDVFITDVDQAFDASQGAVSEIVTLVYGKSKWEFADREGKMAKGGWDWTRNVTLE